MNPSQPDVTRFEGSGRESKMIRNNQNTNKNEVEEGEDGGGGQWQRKIRTVREKKSRRNTKKF